VPIHYSAAVAAQVQATAGQQASIPVHADVPRKTDLNVATKGDNQYAVLSRRPQGWLQQLARCWQKQLNWQVRPPPSAGDAHADGGRFAGGVDAQSAAEVVVEVSVGK
jgi:hypothetical protein